MAQLVNRPDTLVLHCSDTEERLGDQIGKKQIERWHRARGWWDPISKMSIGYHYVIRRSGVVELGRPESRPGAHCYGYNTHSLGICLVGRILKVNDKMLDALIKLVAAIDTRYKIDTENIIGHYETESGKHKTCPGLDMVILRRMFKCLRGQA